MLNWTAKGLRQNKANGPAGSEEARAERDASAPTAGVHRVKRSQWPPPRRPWRQAGKASSGTALRPIVPNEANFSGHKH